MARAGFMSVVTRLLAMGAVAMLASCAPRPALPPPQSLIVPEPPLRGPAPSPEIAIAEEAVQGAVLVGRAPVGTTTITLDGKAVPLAADGRFLVGFGRDAGPRSVVAATLADGTVVSRPVRVIPRVYDEQRVEGLPPATVTLPPALKARRAAEVAKMVAARANPSPEIGWTDGFILPSAGRVTGVYGSRRIRNGVPGSPHNGLDLANVTGTPVVAPADGVVRLAEPDFLLEGGLVIIDHGLGLYSAFLHLSRLDVATGDRLLRGQQVGAIGATGRATGPHLHWGARWGETFVDPALLPGLPQLGGAGVAVAPVLTTPRQ